MPARIKGLVSAVIPAYNAEQSLRRAIDSALHQTYRPLEVIVINDGSTDETEGVALNYGDRIRYLAQDNQGETATRNRGFNLARGEFLTFLDHDDFWEPAFVSACVTFLESHPQAIAVSTGFDTQSALSSRKLTRPEFLLSDYPHERKPLLIANVLEFYAIHGHLHPGCAVLRGSLIDSAGGQRSDLVLSGDMEYWAYLATYGPWGFLPHVMLHADGTQVSGGGLYRKYRDRYSRCATVESWESRIVPRLKDDELDGFQRLRGRVATWYTFAHVFAGKDREAKRTAEKYRKNLEGRVGRVWRMGLLLGWATWKPLCVLVRVRTRVQYWRADRRHERARREEDLQTRPQ